MPRGYPSNAARKRKSDFRDFRPIKPLRPGLPRPRPANDRGTFKPRPYRPFGAKVPSPSLPARMPGNLGAIFKRFLPLANLFELADNAGRNPFPVIHPRWDTIPNGPSRWMMNCGPNTPRQAYYGIAYADFIGWSRHAWVVAPEATYHGPGKGVLAGQAVGPVTAVPPAISSLNPLQGQRLGYWYYTPSINRGANVFTLVAPVTPPTTGFWPAKDALNFYGFRQTPLHHLHPLPNPALHPVPVPHRMPEYVAPGHAPVPSFPPSPALNPITDPWRWPGHVEEGYVPPPSPGPAPAPVSPTLPGVPPFIRQRPHRRRKPPRKTKESKPRLRQLQVALGNALGAYTELDDLVAAAHDALPEDYQAQSWYKGRKIKPSWKKRWRAVYNHWDKVDWKKFIRNAGQNHVEDKYIGKLSSGAAKATRKPGDPMVERLDPMGLNLGL